MSVIAITDGVTTARDAFHASRRARVDGAGRRPVSSG
jgi:hypothetical protein